MAALLFREFKVEHIAYIVPHSVQTDEYKWLVTPGIASQLLDGVAVSAWSNGRCLGAAGIVPIHAHRGACWMILSAYAKPHFAGIIRQARAVLDRTEHKRVECNTQVSSVGVKIAKLLGFECEGVLEAYGVNSEDMYSWKRIKR